MIAYRFQFQRHVTSLKKAIGAMSKHCTTFNDRNDDYLHGTTNSQVVDIIKPISVVLAINDLFTKCFNGKT